MRVIGGEQHVMMVFVHPKPKACVPTITRHHSEHKGFRTHG